VSEELLGLMEIGTLHPLSTGLTGGGCAFIFPLLVEETRETVLRFEPLPPLPLRDGPARDVTTSSLTADAGPAWALRNDNSSATVD